MLKTKKKASLEGIVKGKLFSLFNEEVKSEWQKLREGTRRGRKGPKVIRVYQVTFTSSVPENDDVTYEIEWVPDIDPSANWRVVGSKFPHRSAAAFIKFMMQGWVEHRITDTQDSDAEDVNDSEDGHNDEGGSEPAPKPGRASEPAPPLKLKRTSTISHKQDHPAPKKRIARKKDSSSSDGDDPYYVGSDSASSGEEDQSTSEEGMGEEIDHEPRREHCDLAANVRTAGAAVPTATEPPATVAVVAGKVAPPPAKLVAHQANESRCVSFDADTFSASYSYMSKASSASTEAWGRSEISAEVRKQDIKEQHVILEAGKAEVILFRKKEAELQKVHSEQQARNIALEKNSAICDHQKAESIDEEKLLAPAYKKAKAARKAATLAADAATFAKNDGHMAEQVSKKAIDVFSTSNGNATQLLLELNKQREIDLSELVQQDVVKSKEDDAKFAEKKHLQECLETVQNLLRPFILTGGNNFGSSSGSGNKIASGSGSGTDNASGSGRGSKHGGGN